MTTTTPKRSNSSRSTRTKARSTSGPRPATKRTTTNTKKATTTKRAPARSKAKTKRTSTRTSTTKRRSPEAKRNSTAKRSRGAPAKKNAGGRAAGGRGTRRKPALKVTDVGERTAAYLTVTFVGLTLFGLVMVLSASSVSSLYDSDSPFFLFKRQLAWAAVGSVAFLIASRIDYRILQRRAGLILAVNVVLLVVLLIPGVGITRNSATRWLGVGSFTVQPSELAKLAMVIFVADLLARRERRMDRSELTVRPVMIVLYACSGLILAQPKLGTPVILAAVCLTMLFIAGARLKSLALWTATSVSAAAVIALLTGYQRSRIDGWLDPWDSPQGIGLQAVQSQVHIAGGQLFGVGLGASRAKWGFLPFAHNDFIFAIVAEEIGLIGASALIGAYVLVALFGFRAAMLAPDRFGVLLATGITTWLLFQAFLNIGMVIGVLPITGEALPFISAGGSSLVTMLAAAGLLTSVAKRAKAEPVPRTTARRQKARTR